MLGLNENFDFQIELFSKLCFHLQLTSPFYLSLFIAMKIIQPFSKLLLAESFLRKDNPGISSNSEKYRGGKRFTFRCSSKSISKVNGRISKGPLGTKL